MKRLKAKKESCVSCRICEISCSAAHWGEINPKRSAIQVPQTYPIPSSPRFCLQCVKPKCIPACPLEALYRDEGGIIRVVAERCDGCGLCVQACAFGGTHLDVASGKPLFCDQCGGEFRCVRDCPQGVLSTVGS